VLPVVLHSCGLVEPLLDLIVDVGFDALNPMEVKAGNDPLRIAAKYGDRLAFLGGLDARVLETHDKALIHRETAALIEGMKNLGARFVFASDHSISSNVDYADYQNALEAYHQHKMY
jgi:uroporphyrinogen decarboxylase